MTISYSKKIRGLLLPLAAVLIFTCLQLSLIQWTGQGIPCLFRLITGLKCPGCGVSHMLLAIIHGDFRRAFRENAAVLLTLPLTAYVFIRGEIRYFREDRFYLRRHESGLLCVIMGVLLVYAILRNLSVLS